VTAGVLGHRSSWQRPLRPRLEGGAGIRDSCSPRRPRRLSHEEPPQFRISGRHSINFAFIFRSLAAWHRPPNAKLLDGCLNPSLEGQPMRAFNTLHLGTGACPGLCGRLRRRLAQTAQPAAKSNSSNGPCADRTGTSRRGARRQIRSAGYHSPAPTISSAAGFCRQSLFRQRSFTGRPYQGKDEWLRRRSCRQRDRALCLAIQAQDHAPRRRAECVLTPPCRPGEVGVAT